jgi:chemotaxis protein MotB
MAGLQEVSLVLPSSEKAADEVVREPGTDLDYLVAVLKEQMARNEVLTQAEVTREAHRLVISVPGDLLFASGSTTLGGAGEKAIFALAGVLRNLRNVIEVAGHADPQQPRGAYPSNWELSLARAAAISGMLSKVGYQGGIVVRGYGNSRYQDIDAGLAPEDRMSKARRVDIVIHSYAAEAR